MYETKNITVTDINGKLIEYDACSKHRYNQYSRQAFRYTGKGFIYSINGVKQSYTEKDKMFFWERR
jgi:hypothetical protein